MYQHITVPTSGQKISVNADMSLNVPDQPIVPYIEGDGTGLDITPVITHEFPAADFQKGFDAMLSDGDLIECGHTFFLYRDAVQALPDDLPDFDGVRLPNHVTGLEDTLQCSTTVAGKNSSTSVLMGTRAPGACTGTDTCIEGTCYKGGLEGETIVLVVERLLGDLELVLGAFALPFRTASAHGFIGPPLAWPVDDRRGAGKRKRDERENGERAPDEPALHAPAG